MTNYRTLIEQTFNFPTKEFYLKNKNLFFHGIDLMKIIGKYTTPLKITYLPKISQNIQNIYSLFDRAFEKNGYTGQYHYTYCTKSSHFQFILEETLKANAHIETSSAFDIPIVRSLYDQKLLNKEIFILCNGFKRPLYLQNITELILDNYKNCIPILDNLKELDSYQQKIKKEYKIGMRIATDEEPNFSFYTSRLGIRYNDIVPYYLEKIRDSNAKLKMLHFFINTGIKDTAYYWNELNKFIEMYGELKKNCPELDSVDIGGGFPIKNSLAFEYDYAYMIEQIVKNIQSLCKKKRIPEPNIFTEFGNYTVGESGANIYSILDQKLQNDKELWYMIDGSFITHLPDVWGLNHKFILLPINCWDNPLQKVNLGGLTCDRLDYYDSETHVSEVFFPQFNNDNPLCLGFFNTGAYQESLGGYGGVQHCLIPCLKHVLITKDNNGKLTDSIFAEEQNHDSMMQILGYPL